MSARVPPGSPRLGRRAASGIDDRDHARLEGPEPLAEPAEPAENKRRIGSRARVELEARWRPISSTRPPTLVMLFDLSVRGARLAGWNPLHLSVGDEIELSIDSRSTWRAEVRRVVGDGEYAVQFRNVPPEVKQRLINTVGLAKAGRDGAWADA